MRQMRSSTHKLANRKTEEEVMMQQKRHKGHYSHAVEREVSAGSKLNKHRVALTSW